MVQRASTGRGQDGVFRSSIPREFFFCSLLFWCFSFMFLVPQGEFLHEVFRSLAIAVFHYVDLQTEVCVAHTPSWIPGSPVMGNTGTSNIQVAPQVVATSAVYDNFAPHFKIIFQSLTNINLCKLRPTIRWWYKMQYVSAVNNETIGMFLHILKKLWQIDFIFCNNQSLRSCLWENQEVSRKLFTWVSPIFF